jgi:O-antigen biosynthesis protein
LLVRRHNDPSCIRLMEAWWRELEINSKRDQISLPFVVREHGTVVTPIDCVGLSARNHPLLTFAEHRTERALPDPNAVWPADALRVSTSVRSSLTIGVCVHNSLAEVKDCLNSVITGRDEAGELVIVDDASDEPTASYLNEFAMRHERVRLIRNVENLGYTRSANAVLKAAVTDWIVLLNSDTVAPPRALRKLIEAGDRYPRLAAVGPLSNAASWQTVPTLVGPDGLFLVNDLPNGMTPDGMDRLCEEASTGIVPFVPLVNGFCLAVRRKALGEIGFFDEKNFPVGYGEEDDLCLRAADHGYVCGIATNAYVFHSKSASFTAQRRAPLVAAGRLALHRKYTPERLSAASAVMRNHPALQAVRERIAALQSRTLSEHQSVTEPSRRTTRIAAEDHRQVR